MLSVEENEFLTRVGPGTPMGELLRQYWQPFLRSIDLPDRDGRPLRVKLLGERLIAFRDTNGLPGLVAENCAHRGASLFFGRNESEGLRCVYHGWKFDVQGRCVDMPNEPPESNFKDKVRQKAYPCVERGDALWAYMGPRETPPALPELEWSLVPAAQVYLALRVEECNWTQVMEGEIDLVTRAFFTLGCMRRRTSRLGCSAAEAKVCSTRCATGIRGSKRSIRTMVWRLPRGGTQRTIATTGESLSF